MRPALTLTLAASVVATGLMALWPTDDDGLVPATAPQAMHAIRTTAASPPAPTAPMAAPVGAPALPSLPTRAADWPPPPPAALAAWQGPAAAPLRSTALGARGGAAAAAPPAASAAAAAAEFAYQWIGQLDDGITPKLLLASARRSIGVPLGALIDGQWRLARSTDGTLQAIHQPSGTPVDVLGAPRATDP
ncbi:MAG: hypothetical protein A3E25_16595 [Burkholderiales bacterium RIFCSPHIGHO2_12_FULL_69_20]|nr:MAG: hypothetical protein A3E25_16595 [Burkholderiales bacterium RIFCSPHIGHO2_12_FULL_69_20]